MKIPDTAILMTDGPDGQHWKESGGVLSPGVNDMIFKCKHCQLVTYAKNWKAHRPGCTHPWAIPREEKLKQMEAEGLDTS